MIEANNPTLKSWISVDPKSDFPIQNLPFGVFSINGSGKKIGVRLGDFIIDVNELDQLGYLNDLTFEKGLFKNDFLNQFIESGKSSVTSLRNKISTLFRDDNSIIQQNSEHQKLIVHSINDCEVHLPIRVGDYTDFYSSKEHATNVGIMFRDPNNALLPNWLHIPVGYHGRSSSIIASGQPITRPSGQTMPIGATEPVFSNSKQMDFELEMGFYTYNGNKLGETIPVDKAEDFIFGLALFNDWSARDIQKWEYVPLGPFLGKNFGSSISSWVVTLDALEPYRVSSPKQDPEVFDYLKHKGNNSFDIKLEVIIKTAEGVETTISNSNFKYMYWSMAQQLAHHTVNGCNINAGDLLASGTISGPTPDSYGSMLELAWKGTKPVKLNDGTERKFLLDGDTVVMKAYCEGNGSRIGFGSVETEILPATK